MCVCINIYIYIYTYTHISWGHSKFIFFSPPYET